MNMFSLSGLSDAEVAALNHAVETAFDIANDTCLEDLPFMQAPVCEVSLTRDEVMEMRKTTGEKIDQLMAIVTLREKIRQNK